jgi:hypothetical protein
MLEKKVATHWQNSSFTYEPPEIVWFAYEGGFVLCYFLSLVYA